MDEPSPPKGFWNLINPHGWGFRWGGGVVSNTTFTAIAAFVAMMLTCWALSHYPIFAAIICAGIIFLATLVIVGNWIFSARFPAQAALGGVEYLRLRQAEMGTKEHPKIIDAQNVEAQALLDKSASPNGA